jgi:hypothetical protein
MGKKAGKHKHDKHKPPKAEEKRFEKLAAKCCNPQKRSCKHCPLRGL